MSLADTTEAIGMAMDTLRTNKLRSGLTMLGIMIGVTTVILISSVINGLTGNVNGLIKSLGSNVYWVFRFPVFGSRPTAEMLARKQLTYEDGEAMKVLPHVVAVDASQQYRGPTGAQGSFSVKYGSHKGQIDGDMFTVVGVFAPQKQVFGGGKNPNDNSAHFPTLPFHKIHPEILDHWISVKYDDVKNKIAVEDEIRELLRRRRKVRSDQPDNFAIFSSDALLTLWNQLTGGLFIFLVGVASVGLMVGGVGVMNIMLVSVTERTREIGVRKALGATRNNIMFQFTLEAVSLCALGGVIGILVGGLLTLTLKLALGKVLPAEMSVAWSATAFIVSCAIGLLFGIYPAWKAASLDPIVALRYE